MGRERDREREIDRERDRERQRETDRDRERLEYIHCIFIQIKEVKATIYLTLSQSSNSDRHIVHFSIASSPFFTFFTYRFFIIDKLFT